MAHDPINLSDPAQRAALIAELGQLPQQVTELTAGLSPAQLTTPFLTGEWSVAQNVHHLADAHMNGYIRCKLIATEQHPTLRPYNQDDWAALADGRDADISVSLALLRSLHTRWVSFWQQLPEDAWQRTGFHPEHGTMVLADLLLSYTKHGQDHLDQITRTLGASPEARG